MKIVVGGYLGVGVITDDLFYIVFFCALSWFVLFEILKISMCDLYNQKQKQHSHFYCVENSLLNELLFLEVTQRRD